MSHAGETAEPTRPGRRRKMRGPAFVALALVSLFAAVLLYLSSSLAATHLARLLSRTLHVPVAIAAIEPRLGGIAIREIRLGSPRGFPPGELAAAESVKIVPRWMELLRGRRSFRRIEVVGVRVALLRNREGLWNVAALRPAAPPKKPTPELRVGELVLRDAAVRVEGRTLERISLRVRDLTTRGSTDSRIELSFADEGGSRFRLTGAARSGPKPSLDLDLSAPSVTLGPYGKLLQKGKRFAPRSGEGSLAVAVRYRDGVLRADGTVGFRGVVLGEGAGEVGPLEGSLALAGGYEPGRERAYLDRLTLALVDIVRLRGAATVSGLRSERSYEATLTLDDVDLGRLARLVPELSRRGLSVGGILGAREVRLAGNAKGVSGLAGALWLRDATLTRQGRLLFRGLGATAALAKENEGAALQGRLTLPSVGENALVEHLDAPFTLRLSERFALRRVEVAPLAARVAGMPVTGAVGFSEGAARPLSVSLTVPRTSLTPFNPFLAPFGIRASAGTASLSLTAGGTGRQQFDGDATLEVAGLKAEGKGRSAGLQKGLLKMRFALAGGRPEVMGECRLDGAGFDGRVGEARFTARVADRTLTLTDARLRIGDASVEPGRVTVSVGEALVKEAGRSIPITVALEGGVFRQGVTEVAGFGAAFRGRYHAGAGPPWLEGEGTASTGRVAFRGAPLGTPSARFTLAQGEAVATIGGRLLDGALSGRLSFDPRAVANGVAFTLGLRDGRLAAVAPLVPATAAVSPADGRATLSAEGRFVPRTGLFSRADLRADGVALTGKGGRSVLTGGGVTAGCDIAGERVVLRESTVTAGEGVALRLRGEMARAWTTQREGTFTLSLARAPFGAIVDSFVNVLPRMLQEATVAGTVAAEGSIALKGGAGSVDGSLSLDGIALDIPSQKLAVTGLSGTVPLSLAFGAAGLRRTPEVLSFTKENYPRLLAQLRHPVAEGHSLAVGAVRFGPLELGTTTLRLKTANGLTEITALRSSLYEGELLGKGFVAVRGGVAYGADLLIHDLSLRRLCDAIPKIRGYASGRLDGVVSLYGEGKGTAGLTGFTDLWARESKVEKMLLSKEFLQRLAGKKLRGFFFRDDRAYDRGEVSAYLEEGHLTFTTLDVSHTNFFGVRDLSVSVAPVQNRIALEHLLGAIKEAAARGKAVRADEALVPEQPPQTEFTWQE